MRPIMGHYTGDTMSYPKLLQRLIERRRPVTIYLSRTAFESGIDRHLARAGAPYRTNAVLHIRLSSHTSVRTHLGAAAARELERSTGSTLMRTSSIVAAAYLGEGAFAVLMSGVQASEAELHAHFLVHAISDLRLQWGEVTLSSDAHAGLVIADELHDGRALLAAAAAAGLAARDRADGRSSVKCVDEVAGAEAEERLIPACQIAAVSLDEVDLAAMPSN